MTLPTPHSPGQDSFHVEHTNHISVPRGPWCFSCCLRISTSLCRRACASSGELASRCLWRSNVKKIMKRSSHPIHWVPGVSPSLTSPLCSPHPTGLHSSFRSSPSLQLNSKNNKVCPEANISVYTASLWLHSMFVNILCLPLFC